uniref:Uncharacterized protein n=1 Tax=Rhizophora mucronata TaxID=61149 RepID=A0A2P2IRP7_RHIMU
MCLWIHFRSVYFSADSINCYSRMFLTAK